MNKNILGFGVVAAAVFLLAFYFLSDKGDTQLPETPEVIVAPKVDPPLVSPIPAEPEPEAEVVVEEPLIPAPKALQGSDPYVVELVQAISPTLQQWLVPQEQVRKLVLAIDLMAEGKLPQRHKPIDFKLPGFEVEKDDSALVMSVDNFDRLTPLINSIVEIDPKTLGRYYQSWRPVLEAAYDELGNKQSFESRVNEVIARIQSVGPLPEEPVLVRPNVLYQYSDKALENKSPLEKWLWRMGDENREKLQAYLRELKFYL